MMGIRRSSSTWTVIRAYLLLPHTVPVIVVLLATSAFAFVATDGSPGGASLASLLIAMLGGQLMVGTTNELVDVELDRMSKPCKPIPAGLVTRRGAVVMMVSGLAMLILGSLRFSLLAGILCVLGTGVGVAYSLWFKRTMWSWLPYVVAIPLLPIWVWVAMASPSAALLLIYPIAVPAMIAVHIAQSIPDIEGDRTAGIKSLGVRLGEGHARSATWMLMITSIFLAALSASLMTNEPAWSWLTNGIALGLVGFNIWLWRRNTVLGRQWSFPLVAAAVVVMGVGWAMSSLA